jgi:indole-3-glycerol phosphate synthase
MSGFLQRMARASLARAEAARRGVPAADLDRPIAPLVLAGFDLIAEIKPRSPAEGRLASGDGDLAGRATAYADAGAAAVSVLTEPSEFGGALSHLETVAAALEHAAVPAMRKDFLVDPWQVVEARAAGASGVLLIAALHDEHGLETLVDRSF